ncbi:glyceraldehyde-3-phosphate dehydrogenase [Nitrospirota bacterium]|nr:glyceraldehyde-3-phosphate dehydrogenase [Nitrospirota bacterium]
MATRIGINGFGRIGRNVLRASLGDPELHVVAINDLTDAKTLAYLLKYDSVHGTLPSSVEAKDGQILVDGKAIKVLAIKDPKDLPWKDLEIDIVVESTGRFTDREGAGKHLAAGAKRVIISAPSPNPDVTLVQGVNDEAYNPITHHIISNASCTTNCLAPVAKILLDNFGIKHGVMTTIHSYTNDQQLLDYRTRPATRARSRYVHDPDQHGRGEGAPSGAAAAQGQDRRPRDPRPHPERLASGPDRRNREGLRCRLRQRRLPKAALGPMKTSCSIRKIRSSRSTRKAIPIRPPSMPPLTMVIDKRMVKVTAWYDNEWGYSCRVRDLIKVIAAKTKGR